MTRRMDRRQVLMTSGMLSIAAALPGCSFFSFDPGSEDQGAPPSAKNTGEAPSLAELVKQSKLPPLRERLPDKPLVVAPVERIGAYGGQWRNALIGPGDAFRLGYTLAYENLVRWDLSWKKVIPNVAESFTSNEDGTRFEFRLREGMKWSDGKPFTVDDIVFAYEDVLLDKEISPEPPPLFVSGDKPAQVEKVDERTVAFVFAETNGLFLDRLASETSNALTRIPRHYFQKYHKKYNPTADADARAKGYDSWLALVQAEGDAFGGLWQAPDVPRLHAWLPKGPLGKGTRITFDRNPYYWKTDDEGNQLPYLDGVVFDLVSDAQVLLLKVLKGEIDMIDRHVTTTENKPVLARDRESAGYRFFDLVPDKLNTMTIMLNLTCPDPVKRKIFGSRDFRIGLSYAINRDEIIRAVHARQGEPWQVAPTAESEFYDEEMAKQYTEYDVDLANRHLDKAGFAERNGDGVRLGPDGEPIRFTVQVGSGAGKPHLADSLEMVRSHWREVGIEANVKPEDLTLFNERLSSNAIDATVWDGDGGLDVMRTPAYYLPLGGNTTGYAEGWAQWYHSKGEAGMRPPAPTRRQFALYDEMLTEASADQRAALMKEILAITKGEFYMIGISTALPGYGVAKNDFRNMVAETFFAANFPYPGVTNPEQYFLDA
ncbi:ABC transporter substrate-binding protein [Actinopolymorpha sp. B9G3]|uniref:ABC transporter substrate-binding protein n=1 Tax=Actinopolymorpha sp. B9G3 TaxID=3158970 RepID=UPI0032D95D64